MAVDEIFANNKFPLLENAIDKINEHQLLAIYLGIITYYFVYGKEIINQPSAKILIHIHQFPKCQPLIDLISNYLKCIIENLSIDMTGISYDFTTDTPTYATTIPKYDDVDILISFSQCAGLDEKLPAGTLIIPDKFIPYDIDNKTVLMKDKYHAENSLLFDIFKIIDSKYYSHAVNFINKNYKSSNPTKNHYQAKICDIMCFYRPLLKVDKLWNPTNHLEIVNIK